jgi:hypothetical protein
MFVSLVNRVAPKIRHTAGRAVCAVALMSVAAPALATDPAAGGGNAAPTGGLSAIAGNMHEFVASAVDILGVLMFFSGLLCVANGIMKFRGGNGRGANPGEAFKAIAIGAALIALPTFTGIGLGSILGSNSTVLSAKDGTSLQTITPK